MSGIRENAEYKICAIIVHGETNNLPHLDVAREILSIPELAIVDRRAELPEPYSGNEEEPYIRGYRQAMLNAKAQSWVKEIKDEASSK